MSGKIILHYKIVEKLGEGGTYSAGLFPLSRRDFT